MKLVVAALLVLATPAAADHRCVVEQPPARATPTPAPPPCHRASKRIEKAVTPKVVRRFHPMHTGGTARVDYGCDGLGAQIAEIVVETGSGHGGNLGLWRATRRTDGTYDVRGMAYQGDSMIGHAANPPFELATGTVALPDLEIARAALTATIREVTPPPPPNGSLGISGWSSSRDFHLLVRLTDADGRVVERQYTGYESSSNQLAYLGLEIAADALAPIDALATKPGTATADDRALFIERFLAAVPHFDDTFYWWVMERYVDLARFLGTRQTIAGLLTRLLVADPTSRSKVDARADAVDAIANITGWDARDGGRSVEDAALAYLAQCR